MKVSAFFTLNTHKSYERSTRTQSNGLNRKRQGE